MIIRVLSNYRQMKWKIVMEFRMVGMVNQSDVDSRLKVKHNSSPLGLPGG